MSVDPNFLRGGYFETKNGQPVVRADLIAKHAQDYGKMFARDRNAKVSSNQLRAFYGDVKALEQKVRQGGEGAFDKFYYLIQMLKSMASYIRSQHIYGPQGLFFYCII